MPDSFRLPRFPRLREIALRVFGETVQHHREGRHRGRHGEILKTINVRQAGFHSPLLQSGSRLRPAAALVGKTIWDPARSPSGPVNFLISGKDRSIYVYRNGVLIGQSPVGIREPEPIPAGFS